MKTPNNLMWYQKPKWWQLNKRRYYKRILTTTESAHRSRMARGSHKKVEDM